MGLHDAKGNKLLSTVVDIFGFIITITKKQPIDTEESRRQVSKLKK